MVERRSAGMLLLHGINAGITAGLIFILAEMVMNLAMGRSIFEPLQLISTLGLGITALDPGYSTVTSTMIGLFIHLALSAVYGIIFIFLMSASGQINVATERLLIYGSVFGLLLWAINFLIVAPVVFPQLSQLHPFWQGFVAYTFFFGTQLGVYTASVELEAGNNDRA